MNVEQLVTQLREAAQKLADACAQGEAARRLVAEARQLIGGALGSESQLTADVAALEADLTRAASTVAPALGKVAEAAGSAQVLDAGAGAPPSSPASPHIGDHEPVGPNAPPPSYVRDAARRLSVPPGAKVAGLMFGRDGCPVGVPDGPLVNGRNGGLPGVAGRASLSPGYVAGLGTPRWNRLDVATSHVEGHAAAAMRAQAAPSDVVLVMSQEPCPGPYGCDATLAGQLPAQTRIHVYVGEAGVPRYFGSYVGTGQGVRR